MADAGSARSLPSGREVQFRRLFAEEAGNRLARLRVELPELEKAGHDEELVASIYRDTHTLKGSAAIVGAAGIGRVAQAMEDLVAQLLNHEQQPSAGMVAALLAATDALVSMVPSLLEGEEQPAGVEELVGRLHAMVLIGRSGRGLGT